MSAVSAISVATMAQKSTFERLLWPQRFHRTAATPEQQRTPDNVRNGFSSGTRCLKRWSNDTSFGRRL